MLHETICEDYTIWKTGKGAKICYTRLTIVHMNATTGPRPQEIMLF